MIWHDTPDWQELLHCKLQQVCARVHALYDVRITTFGDYFAGGLDEGLLSTSALCAVCYLGTGC